MTIGVKGQWEYTFSIGGNSDIVTSKNFQLFSVVEEVGNLVPTFKLAFETHDPNILDYMYEANTLESAYGDGYGIFAMPPQSWSISKRKVMRSGESKYAVYLAGVLNKVNFLTQQNIYITDKISSVEAIQEIASKHFEVVSTVKTSDHQHWIQHNLSDRRFIEDISKHVHLPDSFLLTYISIFSKFFMMNGSEAFEQEPFYTLTYNPRSDLDLPYSSDYDYNSRTGFLGSWLGRDRSRILFKAEEGLSEPTDISFEPYVVKDERSKTLGYRHAIDRLLTENHHENYHVSDYANLAGLAYSSNNSMLVNITSNRLDGIQPLDTVKFYDDELDSLKSRHANATAGNWLVTKMKVDVSVRHYMKSLVIHRPYNNTD